MKLTRSTAHRIVSPKVAALILAGLRLKLHIDPAPRLKLEARR